MASRHNAVGRSGRCRNSCSWRRPLSGLSAFNRPGVTEFLRSESESTQDVPVLAQRSKRVYRAVLQMLAPGSLRYGATLLGHVGGVPNRGGLSERGRHAPFRRYRQGVRRHPGARGVSLSVGRGEVVALLGENGAGKSTLIKILGGVYPADGGAVSIDGKPYRHRADARGGRQRVAFVHQDLGLIEWMTVAENMALAQGFPRRGGLGRFQRRRLA